MCFFLWEAYSAAKWVFFVQIAHVLTLPRHGPLDNSPIFKNTHVHNTCSSFFWLMRSRPDCCFVHFSHPRSLIHSHIILMFPLNLTANFRRPASLMRLSNIESSFRALQHISDELDSWTISDFISTPLKV
jgi:hypothetical protein